MNLSMNELINLFLTVLFCGFTSNSAITNIRGNNIGNSNIVPIKILIPLNIIVSKTNYNKSCK